MSKVGQIERAAQNRIVQLFQQQLKYRYLGNLEKEEDNSNVIEPILKAFLIKKGYRRHSNIFPNHFTKTEKKEFITHYMATVVELNFEPLRELP